MRDQLRRDAFQPPDAHQKHQRVNTLRQRLPAQPCRFSVGIFLNSLLFSDSYWIDDPWSYRLPPAYGTLRWVRYYDDALLVDIRDGYVVDVIHDFFW